MRPDRRLSHPGMPLPRSLNPLPAESLSGYLLRLSHRLGLSPQRTALLTGLSDGRAGRWIGGHIVHLDEDTARTFSTVTKLDRDEVAELGLSTLTSRYPPLSPAYLGRRRRQEGLACNEPWVFGRWTRYCPPCLAGNDRPIERDHGGAWQRNWRLPPTFACTRHHRFLANRCPDCRQPALTLSTSQGTLVPCPRVEDLHPTQCRNRLPQPDAARNTIVACGARLDTTATGNNGEDTTLLTETLALQERLLRMLTPGETASTLTFGEPTTVDRYFTDLRLITNLICRTWPAAQPLATSTAQSNAIDAHVTEQRRLIDYATHNHRKTQPHTIYDKPPADSAASASLFAITDRILTSNDPASGGHYLGQLISGATTATWATHYIRAQSYYSPGLQAAVEPHIAAYRPRERVTRPPRPDRQPRLPTTPRPPRPPRAPHEQPPPRPARTLRAKPPSRTIIATSIRPPSPLPPADRPPGFTYQDVPAYLTDHWHQHHLGAPVTIATRHLRRATATALVQYAEQCTIDHAAHLLGIPLEPVCTSYENVNAWITRHPDGHRFATALHDLALHLGTTQQKTNYGARRLALADWLMPDDDWRSLVDQLHQTSNSTQKLRSDWGERKRNTASAMVWTHATQGEHLFAPHRHSPGAKLGTVADRGLSIDRAWWRAKQPGRHYAELKRLCNELADTITAKIDTTGQLFVAMAN